MAMNSIFELPDSLNDVPSDCTYQSMGLNAHLSHATYMQILNIQSALGTIYPYAAELIMLRRPIFNLSSKNFISIQPLLLQGSSCMILTFKQVRRGYRLYSKRQLKTSGSHSKKQQSPQHLDISINDRCKQQEQY